MEGNREDMITSSTTDDKRLTLLSLFEEESLEKNLWQVARATDLAVALADFRGDECTDCINYAEFCRFAREGDDPLCKVANATNAFGITQAAVQKKPFIYFCPYGLLMFAIPIIVNGEFIGGFVGGQVRCEDAPENIVHLKNVLPYKEDYLEDDIVREKYMQANLIPYEKYINMASVMESYFQLIAEKRSVNTAQRRLNLLQKELDDELNKRKIAERKSSKYKLTSMRTQMNPYFVMTTLIAISNMAIIEKAEMTNELINRFADFMSLLFRKNVEIITLQEEADIIDSYLAIYRFWLGDQMEYSLDIADDVRQQDIPAMILFTLVEQSIYHTVSVPDHHTKIDIRARRAGDYVEIRIKDNRMADSSANEGKKLIMKQIEEMQGRTVNAGLSLVRERLEDLFQERFEMAVEDQGEGDYVCRLRLPRRFGKEYI